MRIIWAERMNAAIDYIENNMTGKIDISEAAKLACCSEYHFTRMFSYIADLPLSEYIRNRRLTLAGFMLQRSTQKIIDIANIFGYTSPNSFARAFTVFHGVIPSKARDIDVLLQSYPRITFTSTTKTLPELTYRIVNENEKHCFGVSITTERIAISNQRILDVRDGSVTFLWRDYKDNNKRTTSQIDYPR